MGVVDRHDVKTKQVSSGEDQPLLALRLDDVGASSKRYEVYSNHVWRWGPLRVSGNWLFLKYLPGWKSAGPYRELYPTEWSELFVILRQNDARLTVAVTAAWADRSDRITPFPVRFPDQASVLREGVQEGLIEIANHGLTHCVLEHDLFRPRWFSSNRRYHREFWDWIPAPVQDWHIGTAQDILQRWFRVPVVTFVPPGNVYSEATLAIAERHGLKYVSCQTPTRKVGQMIVLGNDGVMPFHDRDIVLNGTRWLRDLVARNEGSRCCTVAELATRTQSSCEKGPG